MAELVGTAVTVALVSSTRALNVVGLVLAELAELVVHQLMKTAHMVVVASGCMARELTALVVMALVA